MHVIGPDVNVMGSSAVVGTVVPNAAGYALAVKQSKDDRVVAVFFGDGATEEGCFYETINFASLHKLPILFVCENNGYAIHEPLSKRWATEALCERVATFGIPTHHIPDGDVFAIRDTAKAAIARMRAGSGPEFMECKIYRWLEHVGPSEDFNQGYRERAEAEEWMKNDQVQRLAAMVPADLRASIDAEIEAEIASAVDFAEKSPIPDPKELLSDVFA